MILYLITSELSLSIYLGGLWISLTKLLLFGTLVLSINASQNGEYFFNSKSRSYLVDGWNELSDDVNVKVSAQHARDGE